MADYWDEVISGAFDLLGSQMQADAARDAASTAQDGYADAIQEMRLGTDEARRMILDRMNPALRTFNNQIAGIQNEIVAGNADIVNIMGATTGGVDTLLANTGANVRRAMMGSTATSRGIPQSQFDQSFNQVLQMPPEAQTQAFQQLESSVDAGRVSSAQEFGPAAPGGGPAGALSVGDVPPTGGIAGAAGLPGYPTSALARSGGGGGASDSDVGAVSGSLPSGAASALGRAAGGLFGGALAGPLGFSAGQALGSRLGDAAGDGGGPGALAGGSAGGDIASLAAAEAAAGISSGGFTPADSTGGPSKGDPSEAERLRQQSIYNRDLHEAARAAGWTPSAPIDQMGNLEGGFQDNIASAEAYLRNQGIALPGQTPAATGPIAGPTTGGINPDSLRMAQAIQDSARINYDTSATVGRVGSAINAGSVPGVTPGATYQPPTEMPTGYAGAFGELGAGEQSALGRLASGTMGARADLSRGLTAGLSEFDPYAAAGEGAINQEAALSGALGPEAQQQAIDSFIESPGQKYLRERQEQALLRSSAAIGGLGGANVRTALQQQAMGIAATQQQQQLENLRSLAGRGQQVAGARAGMITGASEQMAGLAERLGVAGANLATMTAQQKAALAERAGLSLADLEQQIGQAQIGNLERYGSGLANLRQTEMGQLSGLSQLGALTGLESQQNISTILANLATQQGSASAGLTAAGAQAGAAGQMAQGQIWGDQMTRLGNLAGAAMQPPAQPVYNIYPQAAA